VNDQPSKIHLHLIQKCSYAQTYSIWPITYNVKQPGNIWILSYTNENHLLAMFPYSKLAWQSIKHVVNDPTNTD